MNKKKIILLAGKGESTNIVFNFLDKQFGVELAIIEDKENLKVFLQRRIKRLGLVTVFGQVLFQLLIVKNLERSAKRRKAEIIKQNNLVVQAIPDNKLQRVASINSDQTIELIKKINPDLIIVHGTRIISKKVLASTTAKFINIHAGITPKYRGVHGTYWALVNNDKQNSGVTVHLVDAGIDTGNILYQTPVEAKADDNFVTYPLLQLTAGLKLLAQAIVDLFNGHIVVKEGGAESKLWYHPTIWQYIYYRLVKKVK